MCRNSFHVIKATKKFNKKWLYGYKKQKLIDGDNAEEPCRSVSRVVGSAGRFRSMTEQRAMIGGDGDNSASWVGN